MNLQSIIFILFLYHILFNSKMGWIKEVNDLPLPVKAIIISIGVFMPFWFVLIYYFFPNILILGWYEKVMFLFVPTIIWYSLEYVSMLQYTIVLERATKREPTDTDSDVSFWVIIALDGILYLIIIGIVAFYFKMSFESFLWLALLFRLITAIYMIILNILTK